MIKQNDIKLTVPSVKAADVSRALISIVEAVNNLMSNQDKMEKKIIEDSKRRDSIDSSLDKIGTLRIKKLGNQEYTLQARTEAGWKTATIVNDSGEEIANTFLRLK